MRNRSSGRQETANIAHLRNGDFSRLAALLLKVPPGRRGPLLMSVVSFCPNENFEGSFVVGEYRATFADYWETTFKSAVPVTALRSVVDPPIPIRTAIAFNKFAVTHDAANIDSCLAALVDHLASIIDNRVPRAQHTLFPTGNDHANEVDRCPFNPS